MMERKFEWMVSGDCIEGCTSPPVCPGYWNSPMQAQIHDGQSQCEGVWTFNIMEGYYGNLNLSDLLVSYAFNSPSPFPAPQGTPWRSVIYIDEKANAQQVEALEEIYRICWKAMGDVIMVKKGKIEFKKEFVDGGLAARYAVRIEGLYNFIGRPFRTADKKPRYVSSYWGGHVNVGISEVNEFNDPDLPRGKWNAPGMSITYYDFVLNPDKHHWLP
ncbi:DUF1326 domain-containing protein [Chloroflexota bacterium]